MNIALLSPPEETDHSALAALHVLAIDDELSILTVLDLGLSMQGCTVHTARGGFAGLQQFRTEHPDVVLVDRAMPDLDGLAVAAEIKRLDPQMPVVMITGLPQLVADAGKGRAAIDAVVSKPFSFASLQEGILTALHRRAS